MIRILLVDDQNLVQQGIKSLLDRDPEIKVVGSVSDGRSAVAKIEELRPDIVLLDIEMPGMDGITTTKYITHLAPATKVIILSSHEDKKYLTQALMAGAKAYILKSSLMADLKQSIMAVNSGYSHIESRLLAKIFDPSNLKLNSSKKAVGNSKPSPSVKRRAVSHKTAIDSMAKSAPALIDRSKLNNSSYPLSDTVATPTSSLHLPKSDVTNPSVKNKSVPKIDLPYSIEPDVVDLAPETEINLVKQIADSPRNNSRLLPSTISSDSKNQGLTALDNWQTQGFLVRLNSKQYIQKIATRPVFAKYRTQIASFSVTKKAQYRRIIAFCSSKLTEYRAKTTPLLKKWYEKGWLANLGLGAFGLTLVVIVHQLFF